MLARAWAGVCVRGLGGTHCVNIATQPCSEGRGVVTGLVAQIKGAAVPTHSGLDARLDANAYLVSSTAPPDPDLVDGSLDMRVQRLDLFPLALC